MTRYDELMRIMLTPDLRKALGKGQSLFLAFVSMANGSSEITTNYPKLVEALGEPESTIRKKRNCLERNKVIGVKSGKGKMTVTLLPPYDALATCELNDIAEIRRIATPKLKHALDNIESLDLLTIYNVQAKLIDEIRKLKETIEKGGNKYEDRDKE